ncbi:MAG: cardiolipin synthase ClsB [Pseudomonadota bacterium]
MSEKPPIPTPRPAPEYPPANDRLSSLLLPSGLSGGNQVALLQGGDELFPAMIKAIDGAVREVWVATYIFNDDHAAEAVVSALCQAGRRGVQVRLLVDGFGTHATLPWLRRRCEASGVELAVFRPMHGWWSWLQPGQLRRMHQKLCVVDDVLAFVGGVNVIDDRFDLRHGWSDQPRLDFSVSVRGPVVGMVRQAARALWTRAWLGHEFREEVRALASTANPMARARLLVKRLRMPAQPHAKVPVAAMSPMQAAFVTRDNLRQRRTIERNYIAAIRQARSRVDLMSPYFYPGRAFRRALRLAAKRGVEVRLVLQGKADFQIARFAAGALYDELRSHGVRIFEYLPAFLHAKVALVDDSWATVGSSNIDPLSLLLNLEANVIVRDPAFNRELGARFDETIAASREVQPDDIHVLWHGAWRRALVAWCAHVYLRLAGRSGRY